MFNLLPRDTVFFDLFEELAAHTVSAAEHLRTLVRTFPEIEHAIQSIRAEEHAADQIEHKTLDRLDTTFITPFDREDIHALVASLDSIVDNVRAVGKRLHAYHIESIEPHFAKQADVLVQAAQATAQAVAQLRDNAKLPAMAGHIAEVRRLENLGDENHLAAMSDLFQNARDPLLVIKWKDFYDYIENAINGCQDVTGILERILLKNG